LARPTHLLGFGIAQLVSTAAWPIAILGSASLGAGLAWPGYRLWHTGRLRGACFRKADLSMSTGSSENPVAQRAGTPHRVRVIISGWSLSSLGFVVAVVLMSSAPWVLLQPDQQTRTELNRWFLTVAGSVDAITPALGLRQALLIVEHPLCPWELAPPPLASFAAIVVAHDRLSVLA